MTTLTVHMLYEELIMLQDIMMMLDTSGFPDDLEQTDRIIFQDLYNRVIQS